MPDTKKKLVEVGGLHTLRPEEFVEAQQLIDRNMRPNEVLSMADDFPLLVGKMATTRRIVIKDDGHIVAHAASYGHLVAAPNGRPWQLCNIGAVCCDRAARGRGYATHLVERLLTEAIGNGDGAAILWTSEPKFYERLGFEPVGHEVQFDVSAACVADEPEFAINNFGPHHLSEILSFRHREYFAIKRSTSVGSCLFNLPCSSTYVAEEGGHVLAYLTFGKGLDFHNTVCEWGGAIDVLPALLRHVMAERNQASIPMIGPAHDSEYVNMFTHRQCPRQDAPVAWLKILTPRALELGFPDLASTIRQTPAELLPTKLFGDVRSIQFGRLPIPFYVWGLDSM